MSADKIILWRHGRTASNAEGRFQGQLDVPLDEVGREQVEDAADLLAGLLARDVAAGTVRLVCSDLLRTRQTVAPLVERTGLGVEYDEGLRERSAGAWEGLLRAQVKVAFPQEYARWSAGEDLRIGGGESIDDASRRAEAALRRHVEAMDGGTLVAVTHGAAGRGGLLRLMGIPEAFSALEVLTNAHWAHARRHKDRWRMAGYNIGPLRQPAGSEG